MAHILVTNDDGVTAPGLLALALEMRKLGQVTVLAPDHNWSASGHVKTMHRPLRVKEMQLLDGSLALASDGAPSDCVALAMLGLLPEKVDIVVSGINPNANLGHDVTYSGTVTAAMEASIWGLPGIAVSLNSPENHHGALDYGPAARVAHRVVRTVIKNGLPGGVLLNVNVPYLPDEQINGIRITRQGLRVYRDRLDERVDPRGRPYYWIGGDAPTGVVEQGTDFGALAEGAVSITPLHLDLTAYQALEFLSGWQFSEDGGRNSLKGG
ncbi:MAG: 5'/3'-nucleotidase SurE [Anaerolineales bacterium]|nr:5'/3'-nucleotidase SurE [Anaerolineales bacterium]